MRRLCLLISASLSTACADDGAQTVPAAASSDTAAPTPTDSGEPGLTDADGDGVAAPDDCDDADPARAPGLAERCDGKDNDCDGEIDDGPPADAPTWYADTDGDGYGDPDAPRAACAQPSGHTADATDCDDGDPAVRPGGQEVCDARDTDEDCDGLADDDDDSVETPERAWFPDADADGYGDATATGVLRCDDPGGGVVPDGADCDDADRAIYPDAPEACDGRDNDCDGDLDPCPDGPRSLSGADGRIDGLSAGDHVGTSLAVLGDVNGDGRDDFVVGGPEHDAAGADAGAAWIFYGPGTTVGDVSDADAWLTGEAPGDRAGYRVAGGDADGDGVGDLLVSAWKADSAGLDAGTAYLLLGPLSGALSLGLADGVAWGQAAGDRVGESVALTDLDGDGNDDLVLGSTYQDGFASNAGAVYILQGPLTRARALASPDGRLLGAAVDDFAGSAVHGIGDVDGDGISDLVVGAMHHDGAATDAGAAYIVRGPVTGTRSLADAHGRLLGERAFDYAGVAAVGPGDVDGDGYADLLVGAAGRDAGGRNEGAAYVVHGPASGDRSLALADATLIGEQPLDQAGQRLGVAGDVDGDGHADLLVSSFRQGAAGRYSGAAWLLAGPLSGALALSAQPGKWVGEATDDRAGGALAGGGDLDGDGTLDLLIGAPGRAGGAVESGAAYVLLGLPPAR